jgi:hypothetical protein
MKAVSKQMYFVWVRNSFHLPQIRLCRGIRIFRRQRQICIQTMGYCIGRKPLIFQLKKEKKSHPQNYVKEQ